MSIEDVAEDGRFKYGVVVGRKKVDSEQQLECVSLSDNTLAQIK
jgi:hypothetical protein